MQWQNGHEPENDRGKDYQQLNLTVRTHPQKELVNFAQLLFKSYFLNIHWNI